MEEMTKHGEIGLAAMRAGVDRKTARKYARSGKLPSELVAPRSWRTHEDAFLTAQIMKMIISRLKLAEHAGPTK